MTGAAAEDVLFSAESSAMEGLLIVSEMGALVNVKVISTDAFVGGVLEVLRRLSSGERVLLDLDLLLALLYSTVKILSSCRSI